VSLVLAQALERFAPEKSGGERIFLKWPNDLLWKGRKVGGILLEDRGRLVVGAGVNLVWAPEDGELRREHAAPAGVFEAGGLGPLRLLAGVQREVQRLWVSEVMGRKTEAVMASLENRLAWKGLRVNVHNRADFEKEAGVIVGLTIDGGLRLAFPQGEHLIHSGSISLKP